MSEELIRELARLELEVGRPLRVIRHALAAAEAEAERLKAQLDAERGKGADGGVLMQAIRGELDHAYRKHGRDPWGRHEFYAILLEEVEELWAEIKSDAPQEKVLAELRQVAAMCFRYAETGDRKRGAHPVIPSRDARAGDGGKGDVTDEQV